MDSLHTEAAFEVKSADTTEAGDADLVTKALDEFRTAVDDRLKAVEEKSAADAKIIDRVAKIETRLSRPGMGVEIKSAVEDHAEIEKKAFGTFLRKGAEALSSDERKALTVGINANGGYLVPQTYGNELLKLLTQYSPIRQYARVVQIGGPSIIMPRRATAIAPAPRAETAAFTGSQPTFDTVTIPVFEIGNYTDLSNQVLEDNQYEVEKEIQTEFAEMLGKLEGAYFVNGDGATQPKGLMTATDITSITSANVGLFNADDIVALYHSIPSFHAQNAVWIMNRTTLAALRSLKDTTGRYLLLDPIAAGAPTTLIGRPVVEAIDMPSVATGNYPILFGDLQGYRIADRIQLQVQRDPFSQALNGITRFYGRKRVGAGVTHPDRFMKLKIK